MDGSLFTLAARVGAFALEYYQLPRAASDLLDAADRCVQIAHDVRRLVQIQETTHGDTIPQPLRRAYSNLGLLCDECVTFKNELRTQYGGVSRNGPRRAIATLRHADMDRHRTTIGSYIGSFNTYLQIMQMYERSGQVGQSCEAQIARGVMFEAAMRIIVQVFDGADVDNKKFTALSVERGHFPNDHNVRESFDNATPIEEVHATITDSPGTEAQGAQLKRRSSTLSTSSSNLQKAVERSHLGAQNRLLLSQQCPGRCILIDSGTTLLHKAVNQGSTEVLASLLTHCKICNPSLINELDSRQRTPFMCAAGLASAEEKHSLESAKLLIEYGCDLHAKPRSWNALCYAVENRQAISIEFVDMLLDFGIDTAPAFERRKSCTDRFESLRQVQRTKKSGIERRSSAPAVVMAQDVSQAQKRHADLYQPQQRRNSVSDASLICQTSYSKTHRFHAFIPRLRALRETTRS